MRGIWSSRRCGRREEARGPLPALRVRLPVILLKPPFPVPTPWAYRQWATAPELPDVSYAPQGVADDGGREIILVNDLERPVFAKHLVLADMKMWLLKRPEVAAALMSGSGSTVFAVLRPTAQAGALETASRLEFGPRLWTWQGMAG